MPYFSFEPNFSCQNISLKNSNHIWFGFCIFRIDDLKQVFDGFYKNFE